MTSKANFQTQILNAVRTAVITLLVAALIEFFGVGMVTRQIDRSFVELYVKNHYFMMSNAIAMTGSFLFAMLVQAPWTKMRDAFEDITSLSFIFPIVLIVLSIANAILLGVVMDCDWNIPGMNDGQLIITECVIAFICGLFGRAAALTFVIGTSTIAFSIVGQADDAWVFPSMFAISAIGGYAINRIGYLLFTKKYTFEKTPA